MPDAEQKPRQADAKKPEPHNGDAPQQKPDEDPVGKVYDSRLIKRLGHYLKPYWWQAAVSSVSISLKSISDIAGPFLLLVGMDRYFPTDKGPSGATLLTHEGGPTAFLLRHLPAEPMQGITRLALIYLVCQVSAYLFEFVQTYLMQWTGQKIMFALRRDIFRHMQRMHVGFFDTHAVGRLVTRITSDVDAINEMFTGGILAIVDDFFTLTFYGHRDAQDQVVAGAAGLLGLSADPAGYAHVPQQRARELPPRSCGHRPHQQLHPGTRQRHERGAAFQPRAACLQGLRGCQPPPHDRVQRHDLRLRALLPSQQKPHHQHQHPQEQTQRLRRA